MSTFWLDQSGVGSHDLKQQVARLRDAIGPLLAKGSVRAAYALADRLCRIAPATPADLMIRCLAGLGIGSIESAIRDLDACRAADSYDLTIARVALAASRQEAQRLEAARTIVGHPEATDREIWAATELLVAADPQHAVIRATRSAGWIVGYVAWGAAPPPALTCTSETGSHSLEFEPPQTKVLTAGHGLFSVPIDVEETIAIEARIGTNVSTLTLHAQVPPTYAADRAVPEASGGLTVIVPVHSDAEATEECLASLLRQSGRFDIIVVDDHSPDPAVTRTAAEFCRVTGARHIVNRINLGFAGSVNKALLRAGSGDVLMLNADVVLPDGGLDRMRRIMRRQPDIGTGMPLSNDSAGTSFPIRAVANPPLDRDLAAEVDRIAARLNGEQTVDLVTNIGFCLYVREPCLHAVGLLSPTYGRGYFEDVDFCLKAKERGFRNVALPGLYVTHAGSRSFTSSKPRLVVRNSGIVDARFPDYRARLAAEHWADPLHHHRSMIEEQLPPKDPRWLVVRRAGDPAVEPWLGQSTEARLDLIWARANGETVLDVRSSARDVPQSLRFVLDPEGLRRCCAYLGRLDITGITVAGLAAVPANLVNLIDGIRRPVAARVASRACLARLPRRGSPDPEQSRRDEVPQSWRIEAADSMVAAALQARDGGLQGPKQIQPPRACIRLTPERPNLGIIAPQARPDVDRLLAGLTRMFVRAGRSRLVVLGQCVNDLALARSGIVDVIGPTAVGDARHLFERYRIGAVLSPYRTELFGRFDAATAGADLPRIMFDWSEGAFEAFDRDCVFDWRTPNEEVVAAFDDPPGIEQYP